jgi:hypothetical protein
MMTKIIVVALYPICRSAMTPSPYQAGSVAQLAGIEGSPLASQSSLGGVSGGE